MNINIKATGIELTPAIYDYAEKKVSSIKKYLGKDSEKVVISVEVGKITQHHKSGEVFRAEVHITGAGHDVYAASEEEDLYASIDKVKDEITRELVSKKEKSFTMAKKGGQAIKNMMKGLYEGAGRLKFKGFRNDKNVGE
jgi:putative sigma-54 modulation protein